MLLLTGLKVGQSTHHRKVKKMANLLPEMKQSFSEIAIDGRTLRLRGLAGKKSDWKDYQVARLPGIYTGAFFQENESLINSIKSHKLSNPVFCLGDGQDGIWNIVAEIGEKEKRIEILDGYHLRENLHKLDGKKSTRTTSSLSLDVASCRGTPLFETGWTISPLIVKYSANPF